MSTKVKEFILTNRNTGVRWKIDGEMFPKNHPIEAYPQYILEKYVFSWIVNQWEGIIEISTVYSQ